MDIEERYYNASNPGVGIATIGFLCLVIFGMYKYSSKTILNYGILVWIIISIILLSYYTVRNYLKKAGLIIDQEKIVFFNFKKKTIIYFSNLKGISKEEHTLKFNQKISYLLLIYEEGDNHKSYTISGFTISDQNLIFESINSKINNLLDNDIYHIPRLNKSVCIKKYGKHKIYYDRNLINVDAVDSVANIFYKMDLFNNADFPFLYITNENGILTLYFNSFLNKPLMKDVHRNFLQEFSSKNIKIKFFKDQLTNITEEI